MDQFEVDVEEKNLVGGLDRLIINVGVAIMAVIPTFFYSILLPKKLGPLLSGDTEPDGRRGMLLGPGVFFFLTTILTMLLLNLMKPEASAESSTVETDVASSAVREASFSFGRKIGQIQRGIYENMVDGNIWSAIVFAVPIYLFAVYLGVIGGIIFNRVSDKWTYKDSMGAGLYVIASWILFLIVSIFILFGVIPTIDATLRALIIFIVILVSLMIVPWQYYCFAKYKTQADDGKIIPRALLMPVALITGLILIVFIGF